MKKKVLVSVCLILASLCAQAQTLECRSSKNRLTLQMASPLENSIVTINGKDQLTGTIEATDGATKLTAIDLEENSATILTIPSYQPTGRKDFVVIELEMLGAPGSDAQNDTVVCRKGR